MTGRLPAVHHITFTHAMLVGSAYEVGRQQGEWLAGKPELARFSSKMAQNAFRLHAQV